MTLALPEQKLLTPRLEFPAWVRRIGDPLKMLSPLAGSLTPLGVSAAQAVVWYLAGGAPTPIAAYQPKGAASLAASYVNLANPGTNDAAPGVAPTFDASTGWTFNGTTQYLSAPTIHGSSYTVLVRFSDYTVGNTILFGSDTGKVIRLEPAYSGTHYYESGGYVGVAGNKLSGVMGIAGQQGYFDGVSDGGTITDSGSASVAPYIAATNQSGTPTGFAACKIQAVARYSTTLTSGQIAAVAAAMAAL